MIYILLFCLVVNDGFLFSELCSWQLLCKVFFLGGVMDNVLLCITKQQCAPNTQILR